MSQPPQIRKVTIPSSAMDHVARYATLVVHQLNVLQNQPCCQRCCAPCGVLEELAVTGELNILIQHAPNGLADSWLAGDGVTLEWLRSRWSCRANPACDALDPMPSLPLCSCDLSQTLAGWKCDAHPEG